MFNLRQFMQRKMVVYLLNKNIFYCSNGQVYRVLLRVISSVWIRHYFNNLCFRRELDSMSNVISIYARALRCQHNRSDIFCPILKSFEHMFAVARPMAQIRRDYSLCLLKQFTRVRCHIHRYLKCRKNLLPLFIRCVRKSTRFMGVKGFEREREREREMVSVCLHLFVPVIKCVSLCAV